jgi:exodeoxyribonuclease V alpha subunit
MNNMEEPIIRISGKVTYLGKINGVTTFSVSSNEKDWYAKTFDNFYIQDDDVITFNSSDVTHITSGVHKNRDIHTIDENSRLEIVIPEDTQSVSNAILRASKGNKYTARDFWQKIQIEANELNISVNEYMYQYSEFEAINHSIYAWWVTNRIHRRLWHLGLTDADIEDGKEYFHCDANNLYKNILKHPLRALCVDLVIALKLCKKNGIIYDALERKCADVGRFIYKQSIENKDSYTSFKEIKRHFTITIDIIKRLKCDYHIVFVPRKDLDDTHVYLEHNYHVDIELAKIMSQYIKSCQNIKELNKNIVYSPDFNPNEYQKKAIEMALTFPISFIIGGAGRGKSRVIKEIANNLQQRGVKFMMSSFMGKAVARLREICANGKIIVDGHQSLMDAPLDRPNKNPLDAKNYITTLHRLLTLAMINPNHVRDNQIDHLIVDEVSMLYNGLIYSILIYYKPKFITFVGDRNQLQPQKLGCFLHEMLKCNQVPRVTLKHNYREQNKIIQIENEILKESEYCIMKKGNISTVINIYKKLLAKGGSFQNITILTPTNKIVDEINTHCQLLNTNEKYLIDANGRKFMLGDKIILKKNKKDIDQWNGDLGIIIDVDTKKKQLLIEFSDKTELFSLGSANKNNVYIKGVDDRLCTTDMINHAYCLTIDSSQGSEWMYVIFYVPDTPKRVIFFNFYRIYTAISRCQVKLWCIGDIDGLQYYFKQIPPERKDNLAFYIQTELQAMNIKWMNFLH